MREAERRPVFVIPADEGRADLLRGAGNGGEVAVFNGLLGEDLFPVEEPHGVGLDREDRLDRHVLGDRGPEIKTPANEAVALAFGGRVGRGREIAVVDLFGGEDGAVCRVDNGIGLDLEQRRDRQIVRDVREVGVPTREGIAVLGGVGGILRGGAVRHRLRLVGRAVDREDDGMNDRGLLLPGGVEVEVAGHGRREIVRRFVRVVPADEDAAVAGRFDAGRVVAVEHRLRGEQVVFVKEADGIGEPLEDREKYQVLFDLVEAVRPTDEGIPFGGCDPRRGRGAAVFDILRAADLPLLRVEEHDRKRLYDIARADHGILSDIVETSVKPDEDRALFFGDRGFFGVLAVADRLYRDHLVPVQDRHGEGADPERRRDCAVGLDRSRKIERPAVLVAPADEVVAVARRGAGDEGGLPRLDLLLAAVARAVVVQERNGIFRILDRDEFRVEVGVLADRGVEVEHRGIGGIEIPADEDVVFLRGDLGESDALSVGDRLRVAEGLPLGPEPDAVDVGEVVDADLAVRRDPLGHTLKGTFPVDRIVRDRGEIRQIGVPAVGDLLYVDHLVVKTDDRHRVDRVGQVCFDDQVALHVGKVGVPRDEGLARRAREPGRRDGALPRFDALPADRLAVDPKLDGVDLRQNRSLSERDPLGEEFEVARDRGAEREPLAPLQRPAQEDGVLFFGGRRHDGKPAVGDLLILPLVGHALVKQERDGVRFVLSRERGERKDAEEQAAQERRQKDSDHVGFFHHVTLLHRQPRERPASDFR